MKNKRNLNPFFRITAIVSVLGLMVVIAAIGLYYYIFGITEPEGLSLASWPSTFTDNFSIWVKNEDGLINVEDTGLKRLDEYGLWLQVIDEKGQEVFAYHKPEDYPEHYLASRLLSLNTSTYENGYTLFTSSFEADNQTWSYMIGFPYAIGKYMLYYNGENVGRLSPLFRMSLLFIICTIVLGVFIYTLWLTRHLGKITKGILCVSSRTCTPFKEKGVFSKIYDALNKMNTEILRSDQVQQDTEQMRREWITNITHDLKTPLSPVKGYAEILADNPSLESQTVQEYGQIILKNTNYAERLMNDLKLTYQLESGAIPYHPTPVRMIRYLKELIIDIINDPAFCRRDIEFESSTAELTALLDPDLFRRALQNLIINSLTHNPPETKVAVRIQLDQQNNVCIIIRDNGTGMSESELSELWNRYYRGTNTKEKPEGSGLGLAIAAQIVKLHGGIITAQSTLGEGTIFTLLLPPEQSGQN